MIGIYSPPAIINANILHNGDFLVDQGNEGGTPSIATGTSVRSVDRWFGTFTTAASGAGTPTIAQIVPSAGAPTTAVKSLKLTCSGTAGTATTAGLTGTVNQTVEGADIADLAFGNATALGLTISGWFKCSVASATICLALQNSGATRSYVNPILLPTAATWTQFSLQVPGDILGTWLVGLGVVGMKCIVAFAAGATFQGVGNTWQGGNFTATAAQSQLVNTASATLEMALLKLERGGVATQFISDPVTLSLARYRRYYRKSFPAGVIPVQNNGIAGAVTVQNPIAVGKPSVYVQFEPPMYATPTIVTYNPSVGNANWRDITAAADVAVAVDPASTKSTTGVQIVTNATITTLSDQVAIHYTADTLI